MRMASPPTRASLTSSTRMSRTLESSGSVSRAASSRAASIAWRKVAYSVWPPQFTAHYARAPGAAARGAESGCPSPVPRFRYRPRRQRRPDGRARARAPGGERARQHRASGAGDQRLPRRARGARLAVVEWEAGGWSGGAEAVARLTGLPFDRSEGHTSELQSPCNFVLRLLVGKKKSRGKRRRP